mmetsp:Transcript_111776/g.216567  ORF Transcript_111776/g.216567 Transcript_111776/m.216567 type:complete len:81 (-) Transcript_111776:105-347(-)
MGSTCIQKRCPTKLLVARLVQKSYSNPSIPKRLQAKNVNFSSDQSWGLGMSLGWLHMVVLQMTTTLEMTSSDGYRTDLNT